MQQFLSNDTLHWETAIDVVLFVTGAGKLTKVAKVTVKAVDKSDDKNI